MTQAEIEAELKTLSEQFSQLHERQKSRNKWWIGIGLCCLLIGAGEALTGGIVQLLTTTMAASALTLSAIPLMALGLALFSGTKDTAVTKTAP
jgi:hypothetical protein